MADAHALGACPLLRVEVQVLSSAPNKFDTHSVLKLFDTEDRLSSIIFKNKNDKVPPKQSFGTSPAHSGEVLSSAPDFLFKVKVFMKG